MKSIEQKKFSTHTITLIIAPPIIIFLIFLGWEITGKFDNFDPATDKCTQYESDYECIMECCGREPCSDTCIRNCYDQNKKCARWVKKSFCEKCVDDWNSKCEERCVCEEYKILERRNESLNDIYNKLNTEAMYCFACESWQHKSSEEVDLCNKVKVKVKFLSCEDLQAQAERYLRLYLNSKVPMNEGCVSAREKTPCEKGDLNYIRICPINATKIYKTKEGIGIAITYNESEYEDIQIKGAEYIGKQICICHRKELKDFSCKELFKPLAFDWRWIMISEGKLEVGSSWNTPKYGNEQIYDAFIEKECI